MFDHDHCVHAFSSFSPAHESMSSHASTFFANDDPILREKVIFLPGGKVMVVDWGIQSFAKTVVSVAIAGAVAAGAAVGAILWADARMKSKRQVRVAQPSHESDDSEVEDN